ncbi:MAG TPA: aldehyde dehydrogenase family protein [Actinomycetota bacterium]|nr:aldehyde dehydrogenase family protein [Actinomycetota bacterium]
MREELLRIGGVARPGSGRSTIVSPATGEPVASVAVASASDVDEAVRAAQAAFAGPFGALAEHERQAILRRASDLLAERVEDLARTITLENGKPIRDARGEAARAWQTILFAAEEAKRIHGEVLPMGAARGGEGRIGFTLRKPIGVVAAIAPFNFPLNLVCHKVGPALAAGNTVVLKPSENTPLSSFALAAVFEEAGLPPGALNVVCGDAETGEALVDHPGVAMITFTGSAAVGTRIRSRSGVRRTLLELGSNAPMIVFDDADIGAALEAAVRGSFTYSGQVCISIQRLLVQRPLFDPFVVRLAEAASALVVGDPLDEATHIGPMIDEDAARRVESWVDAAVAGGARAECGGTRDGRFYAPTVLTGVKPDMDVVCNEIFGPVVSVMPFDGLDDAIAIANDSVYGLQAGVFTRDIDRAMRVAQRLDVGGLWINDAPQTRFDHYPYGGMKSSGLGREGVRYAVEEMTETTFVGIKLGDAR